MALSKLLYGLLGLAIIATIGYFVFKPSTAEQVKDLTAVVKKGQFEEDESPAIRILDNTKDIEN